MKTRISTKITRGVAAFAVVTATVAASVTASTSEASALSWKCSTTKKSIDMPQYTGPFPDNYDFTVKVCGARSGSTVYGKTKVSWDGPPRFDDYNIFDAAYVRTYVKKSVSGKDPVKRYRDSSIHSKLEKGDGSAMLTSVKYKIGKSKIVADAALKLNWNNDGDGVKHYTIKASPRV